MRLFILWVFGLVLCTHTFSQNAPAGNAALQSGPMLGYVDMMEALIWAQTKQEAEVYVQYWETGNPSQKRKTDPIRTQKRLGYTAKCIADQVEPGKTYDYELWINGKAVQLPYPTRFSTQKLWQWREDPPEMTVALGSCAYVNEARFDRPGKGYGGEYEIFQSIAARKPDLMLWLGDNVYYREPDWNTRTGMIHRNTHVRSLPELQPLLAATHHYAIWDDHDYGPNDSDGAWAYKETALEVFEAFWGNPTTGVGGQKGITTYFQYGDVDFFLLDNRYHRTPNRCKICPNRTLLGAEQMRWLQESLAASFAPFKIVAIGGQVLTTNAAYETYINLAPAERDSLLTFIERAGIKGVIFVDGDRHFSELSVLNNANGNAVYDITCSPLTSGVYADAATKEKNDLRAPDAIVTQRNFATLRFFGPRKERSLQISYYDAKGALILERTIGPDYQLK
ncbi:MAG: alkaline phosphatase D family protein [Saprospiraceae bacterium]